MATYRGRAVVTDYDGQPREVRAELTYATHEHPSVGWLGRWRGVLYGEADWARLWDRIAFVELTLPDGRAGQVLVKRPGDLKAEVVGAGACPFV